MGLTGMLSQMLICVSFVICIFTFTEAADFQSSLSWQAADTLLQLQNVLDDPEITDEPMAVYRKDLDKDYVAYWLIEINKSQYLVLSADVKTGDYRLNQQGDLPSPITRMSNIAVTNNDQCYRFYMMTPEGAMFCENKDGKVISSTLDDTFKSISKGKNISSDDIHGGIYKHLPALEKIWKRKAMEVDESGEWAAMAVYSALNDEDVKRDEENDRPIFGFNDETYGEQAIAPGDSVKIAIDNTTTNMRMKFLPFEEGMKETEMMQWQAALCKVVINICDGGDIVTESTILTNGHGHRYLRVEIVDDHQYVSSVLENREIGFQVEQHMQDGTVAVRRFGIDLTDEKPRRRKRDTEWSEWEEYKIPLEEFFFPDYEEHMVDECGSGSAAVSWAMIFGYYDRLGSAILTYGHETALFRCGPDGTTGSDECQADMTLTDRMKPYIEHLRTLLDTECYRGNAVVLQSDLDNVEHFFKERGGDHINVETTQGYWFWNNLVYFPRQHVADYVAEIVESSRFPAIVGYHLNGAWWNFSPRYGVVTRVRQRTREGRTCFLWWCGEWSTQTDREMYVHHGDGQLGNGWQDIQAFLAAVAFPH
ncbi:uncharacterized protein [Ptychodera flava]|uniref:uncharacterized protein n=1 Tax=Ptychodera flava TaxID=63121 RepID=UPI00396A86E9